MFLQPPLVSISEEDLPLCNNCKSCYQDTGELFETTTILVDGSSKEVARVIPGVLENLEMTPELAAKAERRPRIVIQKSSISIPLIDPFERHSI